MVNPDSLQDVFTGMRPSHILRRYGLFMSRGTGPAVLLTCCMSSIMLATRLAGQDVVQLDPNMTLNQADASGITWLDPRTQPFTIYGFPWLHEDKVYRRLPVMPEWPLRDAVDSLADCTAGGIIRFSSNTPRLMLRANLRNPSGMYHMPATGQSGFDLYLRSSGEWVYYSTSRFAASAGNFEVELLRSDSVEKEFLLHFPLYNGVESVEIGVGAGSWVRTAGPFKNEGRVVIYGTSITQGGCASRPGMAFPNILSRELDREFINLGFSGNGRGERELARLISSIPDKSMVVLDYQANAGESIRETLSPFIDILRESEPELPILVVSKIRVVRELHDPQRLAAAMSLAAFQEDLVQRRRDLGDHNIHFHDGSDLLGPDAHECTVDGVHPTDLGFLQMARRLKPVIETILSKVKSPIEDRQ